MLLGPPLLGSYSRASGTTYCPTQVHKGQHSTKRPPIKRLAGKWGRCLLKLGHPQLKAPREGTKTGLRCLCMFQCACSSPSPRSRGGSFFSIGNKTVNKTYFISLHLSSFNSNYMTVTCNIKPAWAGQGNHFTS